MKRIWKEYFTFSKKERTAVIILLLLIGGFMVVPYVYTVKQQPPRINKTLLDLATKMEHASRNSIVNNGEEEPRLVETFSKKVTLFPFDPNTIVEKDWMWLGVNLKTIHTIMNYRNKGGIFRSPEDIRKIWGLKKEQADRLIPFVQIAGTNHQGASYRSPVTRNLKSATVNTILDINTATIDDWKTLPGIEERLAARLVNYRERIGGFTDVLQVKKTYGINDSLFALMSPWLKTDAATLPKINLNTVSAYELRQKTNIPETVARAIVLYRQQNGPFQSVEDLKKIVFLKDSLFQKIVTFVKVD